MQDACAPEVIAVESQPDPESVGRISIPSKVLPELKLVKAGIVTSDVPSTKYLSQLLSISLFVVAVGSALIQPSITWML